MLSQNCIARSKATSLPRQSKTSIAYVILCVLEVIGAYPEKKMPDSIILLPERSKAIAPSGMSGFLVAKMIPGNDTRKTKHFEFAETL